MLLSIIIPVFNSEDTIKKTIESIIEQSFSNFELIIVDDGSTDDSYAICSNIAKNKGSNIRIIKQQNFGPSKARNTGVSIAQGDYITFIDADDTINENYFSIIERTIHQSETDLILFGYRVISEKKVRYVNNFNEKKFIGNENVISLLPELMDKALFNSPCNKVYSSKIINSHNIEFDTSYNLGEDFIFNLDYIDHVNSIYLLPSAIYNYSMNEKSLTHSYHSDKFDNLYYVTKIFENFCQKHSLSKDLYYKKLLRNSFSSIIDLQDPNSGLNLHYKRQIIEKILNNSDVVEMLKEYNPNSKFLSILKNIMKTRNSLFIISISKVIYLIKG